jgi:solute carrier family 25 S-adenosylmethionine transporter 26
LKQERELRAYEAAICGSISGGIAAAVTTPLDVMKTRLMLGKDKDGIPYQGLKDTWRRLKIECHNLTLPEASVSSQSVLTQRQAIKRVFFAGVEPRVMWISIGGFIFFGAYEQALKFCNLVF